MAMLQQHIKEENERIEKENRKMNNGWG
jgi:hypothetical protein